MVIDLDETLVHSSFKVTWPLEPFLTHLGLSWEPDSGAMNWPKVDAGRVIRDRRAGLWDLATLASQIPGGHSREC